MSAPRRILAHDVHPWRDEISGSNLEAETDGGTRVPGWEAYSPWQIQYHYRSEEHTSDIQSLMRISYAVFCLKKQNTTLLRSQHILISTYKYKQGSTTTLYIATDYQ